MKKSLRLLLLLVVLMLTIPALCVSAAPSGTALSGNIGSYNLSNGSYYLSSNATGNITVPSGVTATLDLNGYVLTGSGTTAVITNKGNLTINDSNTAKSSYNFKVGSGGLWTLTSETTGAKTLESLTSCPVENDIITVSGGCITGGANTANGGGVDSNRDSNSYPLPELTINGGNIVGNYTKCYGGGLYTIGSVTMNGGAIAGNTAVNYNGGGLYLGGTASYTMNSGNITGNISKNGGGVAMYGNFNFVGGSITGNTATVSGGGVYVYLNTLTMSKGSIIGNTGTQDGGGVYVGVSGSFSATGGSIKGNSSGRGGGVLVNSSFQLTDCTVTENTAGTLGGGVFVAKTCSFTMSADSEISNNTAGTSGGGVYLEASSTSTLTTFTMTAGTITGNKANGKASSAGGGGVYVPSNAIFTIFGGSISNNTATNGGGVRLLSSGTVIACDCAITGNSATTGGGAYVENNKMTVGGAVKITGNTGGNLYLNYSNTSKKTGARKVTVSGDNALKEGAEIGVTCAAAPTVDSPISITVASAVDYSAFFKTDSRDYSILTIGSDGAYIVSYGVHTHDEISFGVLLNSGNVADYYTEESDSYVLKPGNYCLGFDWTPEKVIVVDSSSEVVNLCLNGHIIRENGFAVNGGTLNLYDCDTETTRYWVPQSVAGSYTDRWILQETKPEGTEGTDYYVTFGGAITSDAKTDAGSAITVGLTAPYSGNLFLKDVDIVGNGSSGVWYQGTGTLTLSCGTTIQGNSGIDSGNVVNRNLVFYGAEGEAEANPIIISDDFTGRVGITHSEKSGVFSGTVTAGTEAQFVSDNDNYAVCITGENFLELRPVEATVIIMDQDGATVKTITGSKVDDEITLPKNLKAGYDFENYSVSDSVTIEKGGKFTITEKNTVLRVTLENILMNYELELVSDYVAGKALILVYTDNSPELLQYCYDDMPMVLIEDATAACGANYSYNAENGITHKAQSGKYTYAAIADNSTGTSLTATAADAKITASIESTSLVLNFNGNNCFDVNGTGKIDLNDAVAAAGVYNVNEAFFTNSNYLGTILKADVNRDKTVDSKDIAAILLKY